MPRQIYEFIRQKRNFYATERTGYLTVNELAIDFITDAVTQGAFVVKNVDVIETANVLPQFNMDPLPDEFDGYGRLTLANITIKDTTFPPVQRLRKIKNTGAGYYVGDILTFQDPGKPSNLIVKVTSIDSETGGVKTFSVINSGSYSTATNANKALSFFPKKNRFAPYKRNYDISYSTEHADGTGNVLYFGGSATASTGSAGPTIVPAFTNSYGSHNTGAPADPGTNWFKAYGGGPFIRSSATGPLETAPGRGGPASPFSVDLVSTGVLTAGVVTDWYRDAAGDPDCKTTQGCTRWPINGIWTPVLASEDPPVLFVGQEIVLTATPYGGATSVIPSGTTIVEINSFPCVADQKYVDVTSGATTTRFYYEETKEFLWFEVSAPITVTKGDEFAVKGSNFTIDDTGTIPADKFTVTCEAGFRIDPLNDAQGVTGTVNLVGPGVNAGPPPLTLANLRITSLASTQSPSTSFYPMLYKGMQLYKVSGTGTITGSNVIITAVGNIDVFQNTANITVSTPQVSGLIGTSLLFKFAFPQPYRVAFQANGTQTLNAFVGTEVQLDDDGHIARVTDYSGLVNDLSGIIGGVPTKEVLDEYREEHSSRVDINALTTWKITGGQIQNNELNITNAVSNTPGVKWTATYVSESLLTGDFALTLGSGAANLKDGTRIVRLKEFTPNTPPATSVAKFIIDKDHGATAIALSATDFIWFGEYRRREKYGTKIKIIDATWDNTDNSINITKTDPRLPNSDLNWIKSGHVLAGIPIPLGTRIPEKTAANFIVTAAVAPALYPTYKIIFPTQFLGTTAITFTVADELHISELQDLKTNTNDTSQGFVNRSVRVATHPQSYPLSYMASFTNRGFFFGIWEGTWSIMQKSRARQLSEKDAWFNWILVQRPVDRNNGQVLTNGQSPVFCVNGVGYKYYKFIVRERDVMHPTQGDAESSSLAYNLSTNTVTKEITPLRVPADRHSEDSFLILNSTAQIALTEDSRYLVSFLYNLTTPRFRYSEELDMIGQSAGDVSMASSDVVVTAYGEPGPRVYKALSANLPYNAGLRIAVIKDVYEN